VTGSLLDGEAGGPFKPWQVPPRAVSLASICARGGVGTWDGLGRTGAAHGWSEPCFWVGGRGLRWELVDGGAARTKKKSETMRNAASMDIMDPNTVASVRSLGMHNPSARQKGPPA
jgi:hypothetical protein